VAGGRLDLVLDPVWGMPAEAALRVLSPHGRLVNLGSSAAPLAALGSATLRSGTLSVLGYTNNALTAGHLTADRETLPLAKAAEGWSRCGKPPYRRPVLIP
jgi:NADPH:quinone reductase